MPKKQSMVEMMGDLEPKRQEQVIYQKPKRLEYVNVKKTVGLVSGITFSVATAFLLGYFAIRLINSKIPLKTTPYQQSAQEIYQSPTEEIFPTSTLEILVASPNPSLPTPTTEPTSTPSPTLTPLPTITPTPYPTSTPIPHPSDYEFTIDYPVDVYSDLPPNRNYSLEYVVNSGDTSEMVMEIAGNCMKGIGIPGEGFVFQGSLYFSSYVYTISSQNQYKLDFNSNEGGFCRIRFYDDSGFGMFSENISLRVKLSDGAWSVYKN